MDKGRTMNPTETAANLVSWADLIDGRLGPIQGRDADRIAHALRYAATVIETLNGAPTPRADPAGALLIAVANSARLLANHVFKSVNVGPLTNDPSREAALWLMLRRALESYYTESLSVTKEP